MKYKYDRPRNTRTKMYAGRVALSHIGYEPRALLRLEKSRDSQTDGRQTVTLRLPLNAPSVTTRRDAGKGGFGYARCFEASR